MTLVPTAGVLATVAKIDELDPAAARSLLTYGLYESMLDQRERVWDEIGPGVLAKMGERLVVARTALIRGHVGKALDSRGNSEDLVYAQGMAVLESYIEKGLSDSLRGLFNRKHSRDERGRWIKGPIGGSTTTKDVDPAVSQRSLHNEARAQTDAWHKAGIITDDTPITVRHREVHFGNPIPGEDGVKESTTTKARMEADLLDREAAAPNTLQLEELRVSRDHATRGKTNKQRVAMDIMAAAMGSDGAPSRRLMGALPMDRDGKKITQDENANRWNRTSAPGDRQSFRRMSMTGGLLSNISAPGSTLDTVGGLAQLIGDLGPEAEKVLGPGITRTAYRYRGTEKRPDKAMVGGVAEANKAAGDLDYDRSRASDPAQQRRLNQVRSDIVGRVNPRGGLATGSIRSADKTTPRADVDPVALTNHYWMDRRVNSEDLRAMGMRGDAAVVNLLDALPDKTLTELSVASGELPPSQGVIINANGKVVSQAMGYNGDHYLPFDLKNLNALHGGQYVRTRAHGGPTTEDLYTGLLSGARQIQVISNSGVFTVEFDPDLRGGRRYSDKAARMIDRYGKLLETVVSGDIWQTDLSPEKLRELKTIALKRSNGDKTIYDANLTALRNEARLSASVMTEDDENELAEGAGYAVASAIRAENKTRSAAGKGPLSTAEAGAVGEEARARFETEVADPPARRLVLDGPGYDRALKTLRQEFPYYIRQAEWQSLPDYLRERGIANTRQFRRFAPKDSGHVAPGQTHFKRTSNWSGTPAAAPAVAPGAVVPGTAAAAATTGGLGEPVKSLAEATGPDTPYTDALTAAVARSLGVFTADEPADGNAPLLNDTDEQVVQLTGAHYAHWKINKLREGVSTGVGYKRLAIWLADPATNPKYREKMLMALDMAVKEAESTTNVKNGFTTDEVDKNVLLVKKLVGFRFPFAPAEDDPVMAKPDDGNPKPQPFPDIPLVVGAKPYEKYLAEAFATQRGFVKAVETFTEKYLQEPSEPDFAGMATEVERVLRLAKTEKNAQMIPIVRQELADKQKAFSFIAARHVGTEMDKLDKAGGVEDFLKGLDGPPRRRIIFHKADEEFSRAILASLEQRPRQPARRHLRPTS